MKIKFTLALICLSILGTKLNAQLSGSFNVPGAYPTIAAVITDLNTQGVNGPVTINITAGYTETAPVGGYTLTATGTAVNTITFQKSGVGANPLITAYAGGTGTPGTALQDGVWMLVGSDYITIDGIDIVDPNAANPATMEFGYGMFKASATDGCQYNTIKNCVITLNRINNATGGTLSVDGCRGIEIVNALFTAHTTVVTVTAASGSNSYNSIYSNTIQNTNIGIAVIGYAALSPFTNADMFNDIGGTSISTGNTIINYGGGAATNPAAAIRTLAQYNFNVSYNTINNNNGAGVNHATTLRGIYLNTATSANVAITNNTLTMNGGATTSLLNAIENAAGSTAASNTVLIANNTIQNSNYTTATSGAFGGIVNTGSAAFVNITGNNVTGNTLSGTGTFTGIDGGSLSMTVWSTLTSNTVTNNSKTGASGTFYCMRAGTASLTVNGNSINNNSTLNTSGASSSSIYGFYNISSPTYEVYTNNMIDNLSIGGTSTSTGHAIYGMYSNTSSSSVKTYSNNSIHTLAINAGLSGGTIYGLYHSLTGTTNMFKNKIYGLTTNGASAACHGIYISSGNTINIFNNLIGNLNTPDANTAIAITGIYISGGTASNVYYNTVNLNATSTGALFGSSALYASSTPGLELRNNILINNSTPNGATGYASAIRRSTTSVTSFSATSNNNILYAGTPSANNVIFYDGTNAYQTLATYQAAVAPRDAASFTENTPFISLVGSSANFLHVDPILPSFAESGAINIAGITDDYDADIRQGNPGYTGGGIAPDIGADEYNQVLPSCNAVTGASVAPTSVTLCAGQTTGLNASGLTTGSGIVYQWQVATTSGGPYSNVVGGTGANAPAYTTGTLSAGTFYYVLLTTCTISSNSAVSNEATVTINPVPTASVSSNSPVCSGQPVNFTGGTDIGTSFLWTGPNSFSSTTQNPTIASSTTNDNGVFTLIISTSNCTATAVTTTLVVNATPTSLTVTPVSSTLCAGSSQTISAIGGDIDNTLNFGTQAAINNATGSTAYPAPYQLYYGGQRMQMLILASELSAAGFVTNSPITSVQFPVVSKGSAWGSTVNDLQNFQVSIGSTTVTNLTAFETGLTNVVAPGSFTPNIGYMNMHTFSAPFIWDGTSNVVLETTFSNNLTGTSTMLVAQYNSPVTFTGTIVYRADNVTAAAAAAATTISYSYLARPDFKLIGMSPSVFLWSPAAGLSSTNTLTTVATPASTTDYTLTASNGSCNSTAVSSITVTPIPSVTIVATPTAVCVGSSATLTANGAGVTTYSWSTGSTSATAVVSPTTASSYTVDANNACGTDTKTISLNVNPNPTVTAVTNSTLICTGFSASLTASGANTYNWTGVGAGATVVVSPTVTSTYTVTGTDANGCMDSTTVLQNVSLCTGIQTALVNSNAINLFPNPTAGELTIVVGNISEGMFITVFDAVGKQVAVKEITSNETRFLISDLAAGVYSYRITNSNGIVKQGKLVKE